MLSCLDYRRLVLIMGCLILKGLWVLACFAGSVSSSSISSPASKLLILGAVYRGELAWSLRELRLLRSLRHLDDQSSVL
jgi:hypothetical protein